MTTPAARHIPLASQPLGSWIGGATRAIYADPPGATLAGGAYRFWAGTATIERDAPYSHFAGRTRIHAPMRGGLRLHFQDPAETVALPALSQHRFSGERPVRAELIAGPVFAFNIMVSPTVDALLRFLTPHAAPLALPPAPPTTLARIIYAAAGPSALTLASGEAIQLAQDDAALLLPGPALSQPAAAGAPDGPGPATVLIADIVAMG